MAQDQAFQSHWKVANCNMFHGHNINYLLLPTSKRRPFLEASLSQYMTMFIQWQQRKMREIQSWETVAAQNYYGNHLSLFNKLCWKLLMLHFVTFVQIRRSKDTWQIILVWFVQGLRGCYSVTVEDRLKIMNLNWLNFMNDQSYWSVNRNKEMCEQAQQQRRGQYVESVW